MGQWSDCTKRVFEVGARDKSEYKKFRHAIICELKEAGVDPQEIKEMLRDWNRRSAYKLNGESKIRGQLDRYVDWCIAKDVKIGCNALKDYCVKDGGETCTFNALRRTRFNKSTEAEPHVSDEDIIRHMREASLHEDNFVLHSWVWQALRLKQCELGLTINSVVFVGYRELARVINMNRIGDVFKI